MITGLEQKVSFLREEAAEAEQQALSAKRAAIQARAELEQTLEMLQKLQRSGQAYRWHVR